MFTTALYPWMTSQEAFLAALAGDILVTVPPHLGWTTQREETDPSRGGRSSVGRVFHRRDMWATGNPRSPYLSLTYTGIACLADIDRLACDYVEGESNLVAEVALRWELLDNAETPQSGQFPVLVEDRETVPYPAPSTPNRDAVEEWLRQGIQTSPIQVAVAIAAYLRLLARLT